MGLEKTEIQRRTKVARAAISSAYGTDDDEYGATLFISHHLEEIESSYWEEHFKTPTPKASAILDALVLIEFDDEADLDMFDFTLPGDVTNYLICVRFNKAGEVEEVVMES